MRPSPLSDPVRYRKCPACGDVMARRNFLETSGVIIDVCTLDGVWFDRGELSTLFAFVESGAAARAEHDIAKRAEATRRLDAFERDLSTVLWMSTRR